MEIWNKVVGVILAIPFFFIAGCAPYPQHYGRRVIMSCTETTISVQPNLICPADNYPANFSLNPKANTEIASTACYPEVSSNH